MRPRQTWTPGSTPGVARSPSRSGWSAPGPRPHAPPARCLLQPSRRNVTSIVTRYSEILPLLTLAFCSTTCRPVMPRSVLLARSSPSRTAASKLCADAAHGEMPDDPCHDPAPEPWPASLLAAVPHRSPPGQRSNQPDSVSFIRQVRLQAGAEGRVSAVRRSTGARAVPAKPVDAVEHSVGARVGSG